MINLAPPRPLLRWLGGKFRLAPWIIAHFPEHRIYVEPFGGAGSVLLQKPRAYNETWNDLDGELVNLFRVLRGDQAQQLRDAIALTPYARDEYWGAFSPSDDPVERARRCIVRSHFAFGTGGARIDRPTGFRTNGTAGTTNVSGEWGDMPQVLDRVIDRLRGVTLEQLPAQDLIRRFDDPKVLIYLDPPYWPATRSTKSRKPGERYHAYAHELSEADHFELLELVNASSAMIAISGYPSAAYDAALTGWTRRTCAARAHRNSPRTEVLWLNQALMDALACRPGPLFVGALSENLAMEAAE